MMSMMRNVKWHSKDDDLDQVNTVGPIAWVQVVGLVLVEGAASESPTAAATVTATASASVCSLSLSLQGDESILGNSGTSFLDPCLGRWYTGSPPSFITPLLGTNNNHHHRNFEFIYKRNYFVPHWRLPYQ